MILILAILEEPSDPCSPSPCGPNSQCRVVNGQGVCSCLPSYVGSPPGCRPECVVSPECPRDKACLNQKCVNPCPGPCGQNTRCEAINHSPICTCQPGYTGDPFSRCYPIPRKRKTYFCVLKLTVSRTRFECHAPSCKAGATTARRGALPLETPSAVGRALSAERPDAGRSRPPLVRRRRSNRIAREAQVVQRPYAPPSLNSCSSTAATSDSGLGRPVRALSLRSVLGVQGHRGRALLLVPLRLHGQSTKLPAGVRHQLRVP